MLSDKQQKAIKKLHIAGEKFLLDFGWKKDGKHFSPPTQISFVWPEDKVYLETALDAQLTYLKGNDYI